MEDHTPTSRPPDPSAVTSLRPIASRPGWLSICIDRRRVGALTAEACARLAIAVGTPWTPALAAAFAAESDFLKALHDATALLRNADRTTERLTGRLAAKGHSPAAIARAHEHLRARGLLDDDRHAADVARRHAERHRDQPFIEAKLRALGHTPETAAQAARESVAGLDPVDRAERLLRSRQAVNPRRAEDPARARRRLHALLLRNGFEDEVARAALERVLGELDPES